MNLLKAFYSWLLHAQIGSLRWQIAYLLSFPSFRIYFKNRYRKWPENISYQIYSFFTTFSPSTRINSENNRTLNILIILLYLAKLTQKSHIHNAMDPNKFTEFSKTIQKSIKSFEHILLHYHWLPRRLGSSLGLLEDLLKRNRYHTRFPGTPEDGVSLARATGPQCGKHSTLTLQKILHQRLHHSLVHFTLCCQFRNDEFYQILLISVHFLGNQTDQRKEKRQETWGESAGNT